MISVSEAEKIIFNNLIDLPSEACPLPQANGRILREDLKADRDFPPFDRIMMDGIAISYQAWQQGQTQFILKGTQLAGTAPLQINSGEEAIEIMTGAVCPTGCDTVIPVEQISIHEEGDKKYAQVQASSIEAQQHIHQQGSDRQTNSLLVPAGTLLSSSEIAVAASIGKSMLQVSTLPKVAIISTGDELVEVAETPLAHQIRRSNVYALASSLQDYKIPSSLFHLMDDKKALYQRIEEILDQFDLIILSGGVSKGKADYVPEILAELGVQKLFHRVRQRPGKPFWFGRKDEKLVFALPGNPVSTVACFYRYVLPYIQTISGMNPAQTWSARLANDFTFEPALTLFLPVQVSSSPEGVLMAQAFPGHGSGDFANLLNCHGLLALPEKQKHFLAGEVFPLLWLRDMRSPKPIST